MKKIEIKFPFRNELKLEDLLLLNKFDEDLYISEFGNDYLKISFNLSENIEEDLDFLKRYIRNNTNVGKYFYLNSNSIQDFKNFKLTKRNKVLIIDKDSYSGELLLEDLKEDFNLYYIEKIKNSMKYRVYGLDELAIPLNDLKEMFNLNYN